MNSRRQIRNQRLWYDLKIVREMCKGSQLIKAEAYADRADLEKRRNPITRSSGPRIPLHYLIHFNILSLVGRGEYHRGYDVQLDLESLGAYPERSPDSGIDAGGITAACVSRPVPWNPHFLDGIGSICLGDIWNGAAHTLLAHVILHIARLLNWENERENGYGGWNPAAVRYWREHLGAQPLNRLDYPDLPLHLTHGATSSHRAMVAPPAAPPGPESSHSIQISPLAPSGAPAKGRRKPIIIIRET